MKGRIDHSYSNCIFILITFGFTIINCSLAYSECRYQDTSSDGQICKRSTAKEAFGRQLTLYRQPFLAYQNDESKILAPVSSYTELLTNDKYKNKYKYYIADMQWRVERGDGLTDPEESYYIHTILLRHTTIMDVVSDVMRYDFQFNQSNSSSRSIEIEKTNDRIALCEAHLDLIESNIGKRFATNDQVHHRAIQIIDSFGRPEYGWTLYTPFWPGDFDLCESINFPVWRSEQTATDGNKDSSKLTVPMRYCHARMRHKNWPNSTYFRRVYTQLSGVCLPSSCANYKSTIVNRRVIERVDRLVHLAYGTPSFEAVQDDSATVSGRSMYLDSLFCQPTSDNKQFDDNDRLLGKVDKLATEDRSDRLDKKISTSGRVLIGFLIVYSVAICASTIYCIRSGQCCISICDCFGAKHSFESVSNADDEHYANNSNNKTNSMRNQQHDNRLAEILTFLCVITNTHNFFTISKRKFKTINNSCRPNRHVDFDFTAGLRVVGLFMIAAGHYALLKMPYIREMYRVESFYKEPFTVLLNMPPIAYVNVFFVMTGLISAYQMLRLDGRHLYSPVTWIMFFVARYVRIIPLYALIDWFQSSLFVHTGSGPYWDYGTVNTSWSYACQNNHRWHKILIPIANLDVIELRECTPVGWYLANDIQFALVAPALILLVRKMPRTFITLTGALCALYMWLYVAAVYKSAYNLEPARLYEPIAHTTTTAPEMSSYYLRPWFRGISYLLGVAAGQTLLVWATQSSDTAAFSFSKTVPRLSRHVGLAFKWLMVFLLIINASGPFNRLVYGLGDAKWKRLLTALQIASLVPVSSLVFAAAIIGLASNRSAIARHWLSARLFRIYSRAGLSFLLVHMPVILYIQQTRRRSSLIDTFSLATEGIASVVMSLIVAIIVYIIFEAPVVRAVRLMMDSIIKRIGNTIPAKQ